MLRDSMTGNPALAIFEAMLMIFASLFALAEAGAKIGHVPAWALSRARRPRSDHAARVPRSPQPKEHPMPRTCTPRIPANARRRPDRAAARPPPSALRRYIRLRRDEPGPKTERPSGSATPIF